MSKKETSTKQPTAEGGSTAFVDELLKNGTVILKAKTRDELAEMLNDIPADCRYGAGAVGQDYGQGVFTLRLDLTT